MVMNGDIIVNGKKFSQLAESENLALKKRPTWEVEAAFIAL